MACKLNVEFHTLKRTFCPNDLLVKGNEDVISNWLERFAVEEQRQE